MERQLALRDSLLMWLIACGVLAWARLAGRELAGRPEADLPSLPVLTRAEMMEEVPQVDHSPRVDARSSEGAS